MVDNQSPPIKEPKMPDKKRKTISAKESGKAAEEEVGLAAAEERAKKREYVRSYIALIYVVGYLIIIAGAIIIATWRNFSMNDSKDILLTISAILSGPLGFIIGYYFKTRDNE